MRQSSVSNRQLSVDDKTIVAARIVDFLRRVHPSKTAENVASDLGVSAATVQKWLDRGSAPNNLATMRMLCAYGPEFVCTVVTNPPAWLDRAAREEQRRRVEAQIAGLQAQLDGGAR